MGTPVEDKGLEGRIPESFMVLPIQDHRNLGTEDLECYRNEGGHSGASQRPPLSGGAVAIGGEAGNGGAVGDGEMEDEPEEPSYMGEIEEVLLAPQLPRSISPLPSAAFAPPSGCCVALPQNLTKKPQA